MITIFEEYNIDKDEVKVGDYALIQYNAVGGFRFDHIGKVIKIKKHYDEVEIKFDEPLNTMYLSLSQIKHWSSNKEDLEALQNSEKYNL